MKILTLTIRLLEDLHVGSGLGSGDTDATQARDVTGAPVIWWTHLKGVLRVTAEQLLARGGSTIDPKALFGWDPTLGPVAVSYGGTVCVASAYLNRKQSPSPSGWFRTYTSTARAANDRQPLADTKRTQEWVSAGCTFSAFCFCLNDADANHVRTLAAASSRLGADRSRGSLVHITASEVQNKQLPNPTISLQGIADAKHATRLVLTLRALDPLSFPTASITGNIIDTQSFISGAALLGALVAVFPDEKSDGDLLVKAVLVDRNYAVGNGYPLPAHHRLGVAVSQRRSLPAPLSYRKTKSSAARTDFPDWALRNDSPVKYLSQAAVSTLGAGAAEAGEKRLGDHTYVYNGENGWELYQPPLAIRMRIGVPTVGWSTLGNDQLTQQNQQALFTSEEISEGTRFRAEIRCLDIAANGGDWFHVLRKRINVLNNVKDTPIILFLGRGRRPVLIERVDWASAAPKPQLSGVTSDSTLTMMLTSDLILRGPKFGFITLLDKAALAHMFSTADPSVTTEISTALADVTVECVSDSSTVGGFNASSGIPRAQQLAIRRGSVLMLRGTTAAVNLIADCLISRPAWGERLHEGYGQIEVVDFAAGSQPQASLLLANNESADEAASAQAKGEIQAQTSTLAKLFKCLPKTALYDFVALAKRRVADGEAAKQFDVGLQFAVDHYTLRIKQPNITAAVDQLRRSANTETSRHNEQMHLYFLVRWAVALGEYQQVTLTHRRPTHG